MPTVESTVVLALAHCSQTVTQSEWEVAALVPSVHSRVPVLLPVLQSPSKWGVVVLGAAEGFPAPSPRIVSGACEQRAFFVAEPV